MLKSRSRFIIDHVFRQTFTQKNLNRLLPLSGLLAGFCLTGPAHADCDQRWGEVFSSAAPSSEEKAQRWQQLRPDCGGDASYDHRLALLLTESGRFDEAEAVIRQSIDEHSDPDVLAVLEYDLIDIERARVFSAGDPGAAALRKVLGLYLEHNEKYRGHAPGYSAAAGIYLLLDEPQKAVGYSRRALTIEPDYLAYRSLAIALTRLDQFELALDSAILASELNPAFPRDIDLMMSVAFAYISMDDVDNAKASLGALLRARPEIRGQEQFDRLVGFVYQRADELERQVE